MFSLQRENVAFVRTGAVSPKQRVSSRRMVYESVAEFDLEFMT